MKSEKEKKNLSISWNDEREEKLVAIRVYFMNKTGVSYSVSKTFHALMDSFIEKNNIHLNKKKNKYKRKK